ncbi:MAG: Uma2 family endonuclease [Polyangiaceae bacterium]
MALLDITESYPYRHGGHLYVTEPTPIHFPEEESLEEAVSETKRHLEARTTLYLLLKAALPGMSVGSDQFVYWDPRDPRKCLSPDAFVKLATSENLFDTWKVWERGAPDLAIEIASASDRQKLDWSEKMERYQASGIQELVRFDADSTAQPIRVWDRIGGGLVERARKDPELCHCGTLDLWWVAAPSEYGPQLRLSRDREGQDLLVTPAEHLVRVTAELGEERGARARAEHEREIERHERLRAEEAREAEARARAEAEALSAEKDRELQVMKAELERLRAARGAKPGA